MTQGATALPDTFAPSSFGVNNTTFGPQFRARWICSNERYRELDRRQSYYDCSQHDWKQFDFDGRTIRPGPPTQQPLLITEQSGQYVPLKARRPSSPYRLPRIMVNSFTNIVFGENRFPQVHVDGDADSQDFLQAICKLSALPVRMIQARNMGGSVGSVGMSWCYRNGRPRVLAHNPKHLHVHEWEDREDLVPKHVSEVYYYPDDVFDRSKNKYVRKWYWYRRDWTPEADLVFQPVEFRGDRDPTWTVDRERSIEHNDGFCHLVWTQNMPSDEVDGIPDYHGLYENFDSIDTVLSVLNRGTVLNLDPTLVLKMDLDYVARMGVKKGSDNALVVGESGSAEYLELGGSSATAGLQLFEAMRKSVLEVAQCVVADPNQVTAAGVSSVALKVIYAPMLSRCDLLREQYGEGMRRLLTQMLKVAQATKGKTNADGAELVISLPPRAESEPVIGDDGKPTGEVKTKLVPRTPGEGEYTDLVWGPYFLPTADDQSKVATTLQIATGGKAFLSKESATEIAAAAFGLNIDEENRRVTKAAKVEAAAQDDLFADARGDVGGKVPKPDALPPGATARQPRSGNGEPGEAAPKVPAPVAPAPTGKPPTKTE